VIFLNKRPIDQSCVSLIYSLIRNQAFSSKKPLNRKDRRHLQNFDVSKAFLHSLSNEPTLPLPNKKEEIGVQSPFVKGEKMGDLFNREVGEWFHLEEVKMHREQLKRNGEITLL
jgi:hypothetical protein